jgi:polar amino acid transport system substrate-binding protein
MQSLKCKTTVLSLSVAAVLSCLGSAAAMAANLEQIESKGTMMVATEDSYKPFEYIQDGKPMGLDHALLALLRQQAPFKIDQQIIPWTGLLAGVVTGKYDEALTAAVITPERVQSLDFTMPIADATQYYVVRTNETRIKGIPDLAGKTVGVQSGGASYAALTDLEPKLAATGGKIGKVVQYTSLPEAYQDLANGRLDYVINGVVNLVSLTKEQPTRFKMGEAVGARTYAAWAVAKGNSSLLNYLNAFITKIRVNGELYDLQEKWLGRAFKDMPNTATTN